MEQPATTSCDRRQAFAALLERHRGVLVKVAGSYAWQREDRDDLMQDIAAQLWRAWPSYDAARPFSTWMYRIALNVAISHVRSRMRSTQADSWNEAHHDLPDPRPHDPEMSQQVERLHRFIHALPPLERALMLLYLEDCSYREMAGVLGLSETNVATKIGRLKARIRHEL
ncbi:MAG: sigma-70 family RNA polymerase sigma factor [Gammaproteobacteria bacterium]